MLKNPHITAKELQKRLANTGLVRRTKTQCTLNNKDLHGQKELPELPKLSIGSMQKKRLRGLKPFGTCLGLTKPKLNFLATTKEGVFGGKKSESFVEKNTFQLRSMEVEPLCFGVVWQLGAQEIVCKWKEERIHQISRRKKKFTPDIEVEERLGIPAREGSKAYIKINHEVPPGKTNASFGLATTVPRLIHSPQNIIESLWRDLKQAVHTRRTKNISARKNGEKFQKQKVTERVPKLLHRAFFLFLLF